MARLERRLFEATFVYSRNVPASLISKILQFCIISTEPSNRNCIFGNYQLSHPRTLEHWLWRLGIHPANPLLPAIRTGIGPAERYQNLRGPAGAR